MPGTVKGPKELEIEEQIRLPGHQWQLSSLEFSPNGLFLASGSWDRQVRIWDLSKVETSKILGDTKGTGHNAPVTALSWLPTIEFLVASSSADKTTILWNSDNANKMATFKEHTGWVLGNAFTKSGNHLATCSWDKSVIVWDVTTLKLKERLIGHTGGVWNCKFHSIRNENTLCTASEDSSLRLWDIRANTNSRSQAVLVGAHDDSVRCCAWSPGGTYVAAGSTDMKISVWDVRENKVLTTIQGHEDTVTDVQFLPRSDSDSSPVLVSVGDTTCRFWDALRNKSKQLQCLRQHKNDLEVECVSVSPDGSLLSTGGRDNNIILSTINIPDIGLENLYHEDTFISKGDFMWKKASREVFLTSSSDDIASPRGRTLSSSAKIVDNAVQQNELKEQEKSQAAAKQTIKIKSTATNEILQSKLMQLQKTKKTSSESKDENERSKSPENVELQNQRKKLHHIERSQSQSDEAGSTRWKSKELESERQKLRSVQSFGGVSVASNYYYEETVATVPERKYSTDGARFPSFEATAMHMRPDNSNRTSRQEDFDVYESINGSIYARSDGGDSLLYEDIKDIAEELIRISDEQSQQIQEEQRLKALGPIINMGRRQESDQEKGRESYDARL